MPFLRITGRSPSAVQAAQSYRLRPRGETVPHSPFVPASPRRALIWANERLWLISIKEIIINDFYKKSHNYNDTQSNFIQALLSSESADFLVPGERTIYVNPIMRLFISQRCSVLARPHHTGTKGPQVSFHQSGLLCGAHREPFLSLTHRIER